MNTYRMNKILNDLNNGLKVEHSQLAEALAEKQKRLQNRKSGYKNALKRATIETARLDQFREMYTKIKRKHEQPN